MMHHFLIVARTNDEQDLILEPVKSWADSQFDGRIKLSVARSADKARKTLLKKGPDIDLLITLLELGATGTSSLKRDEHLGLKLAQDFRAVNSDTPVIIVADSIDTELHEKTENLDLCKLVALRHMPENLERSLGHLMASERHPPGLCDHASERTRPLMENDQQRETFDLEIVLRKDIQSYRISGVVDIPPHRLILDDDFLDTLKVHTEILSKKLNSRDKHEDWEIELKIIGKHLRKALLASPNFNSDFNKAYGAYKAFSAVGRNPNFFVRFSVEKDAYTLALEALYGEPWKWWMLEAPITRRLHAENSWVRPLFRDQSTRRQPVNILVIEAMVSGYARPEDPEYRDRQYNFEVLKNVPEECAHLRKLAQTQTPGGQIRVVSIPQDTGLGNAQNFRERVRSVLTGETTVPNGGGPFHIVHFAGHSIYDKQEEKSFLVFPGKNQSEVDLVPAEDFAAWLEKAETRFVYLSSCRGSESEIVHELAHHQVPAILGFRWDIEDDKATMHAETFYNTLLSGERRASLEDAFLKTRKQMHYKARRNHIWAAPVMIVQSSDRPLLSM